MINHLDPGSDQCGNRGEESNKNRIDRRAATGHSYSPTSHHEGNTEVGLSGPFSDPTTETTFGARPFANRKGDTKTRRDLCGRTVSAAAPGR